MYRKVGSHVLCVLSLVFGSASTVASEDKTLFFSTSMVVVPTIPSIKQDEFIFVCIDQNALEDIVIGGLYETAKDNEVCGLIEAGQLTYIGSVVSAHTVLVEGVPMGTGFYQVQACARSYSLAWPYTLDQHHVDPELATDIGPSGPLIQEGFPAGTCKDPNMPAGEILLSNVE